MRSDIKIILFGFTPLIAFYIEKEFLSSNYLSGVVFDLRDWFESFDLSQRVAFAIFLIIYLYVTVSIEYLVYYLIGKFFRSHK